MYYILRTLPIALLFLITHSIYAQNLEESEIRSAKKIGFNNRSAKRADISVKRKNYRLGKRLAENILDNPKQEYSTQNTKIRRFQANSKQLLGADVLTIGRRFRYGHVHSLVRILTSYVENAFSYRRNDAKIIAEYILYYNALHRNEKSYFRKKFTPQLIDHLQIAKVGISIDYKNWAGNSQIVIPTGANILNPSGNDITLGNLEKEVNQVLKDRDDKISLKKRFDKLRKERILKEKKTLIEKKQEFHDKDRDLSRREQESDRQLNEYYEDPQSNREKIREIEKQRQQLAKERQVLDREAQLLQQKDRELNGKTNLKRRQPKPRQKDYKSLVKENKDLKNQNNRLNRINTKMKKIVEKNRKQRREKNRQSTNVIEGKIYFMKIIKYLAGGRYNNEIYLIDPLRDDIIVKSEYANITSTFFKEYNQSILVIGFEENHRNGNKLVALQKGTLKLEKLSTTTVFWKTPLLIDKQTQNIYAYEEEDDKFYLSKFNADLQRVKRSKIEINPLSRVTLFGNKIYLTAKEQFGKKPAILIFDKTDLKLIKKIDDTGN